MIVEVFRKADDCFYSKAKVVLDVRFIQGKKIKFERLVADSWDDLYFSMGDIELEWLTQTPSGETDVVLGLIYITDEPEKLGKYYAANDAEIFILNDDGKTIQRFSV
jgi:hypothetical protein